jgi:hypothetical protein
MRERLDEHSRFLEEQLAGLEALVKEKGETDVIVPAVLVDVNQTPVRHQSHSSSVVQPNSVPIVKSSVQSAQLHHLGTGGTKIAHVTTNSKTMTAPHVNLPAANVSTEPRQELVNSKPLIDSQQSSSVGTSHPMRKSSIDDKTEHKQVASLGSGLTSVRLSDTKERIVSNSVAPSPSKRETYMNDKTEQKQATSLVSELTSTIHLPDTKEKISNSVAPSPPTKESFMSDKTEQKQVTTLGSTLVLSELTSVSRLDSKESLALKQKSHNEVESTRAPEVKKELSSHQNLNVSYDVESEGKIMSQIATTEGIEPCIETPSCREQVQKKLQTLGTKLPFESEHDSDSLGISQLPSVSNPYVPLCSESTSQTIQPHELDDPKFVETLPVAKNEHVQPLIGPNDTNMLANVDFNKAIDMSDITSIHNSSSQTTFVASDPSITPSQNDK